MIVTVTGSSLSYLRLLLDFQPLVMTFLVCLCDRCVLSVNCGISYNYRQLKINRKRRQVDSWPMKGNDIMDSVIRLRTKRKAGVALHRHARYWLCIHTTHTYKTAWIQSVFSSWKTQWLVRRIEIHHDRITLKAMLSVTVLIFYANCLYVLLVLSGGKDLSASRDSFYWSCRLVLIRGINFRLNCAHNI